MQLPPISCPSLLDNWASRFHTLRYPTLPRKELAAIAKPLGYSLETIEVKACLHLKSAVTSVGDHTLLYNPKWVSSDAFEGFNMIPVHPDEPSAGNCVDLDGVLLHGEDFPKTRAVLEDAGFSVAATPMDELAKAEGAATCCSLLLQST